MSQSKFEMTLALVWGLTIGLTLNAPTAEGALKVNPGHAEEIVPGKILVRTIRLQNYLEQIQPDEIVEKRDSLGGENPDIFIVYKKKADGAKTLELQLFDLNRDGKIDLVKHYEKGKLVREERDTDYDGITDIVIEYDGTTGAIKKKSQADKHTNIWTYFVKNEIYRKEVDRNFDGKPDMWVYYRKGKIYRTEIDKNFNGKKIVKIEGPYNPKSE